jgi:hypothetical protein
MLPGIRIGSSSQLKMVVSVGSENECEAGMSIFEAGFIISALAG